MQRTPLQWQLRMSMRELITNNALSFFFFNERTQYNNVNDGYNRCSVLTGKNAFLSPLRTKKW